MMQFIKRMLGSITPENTRANGGAFLYALPRGGALTGLAGVALTADTAVAWKYGAVGAAITVLANLTECWIEGIVLHTGDAINQQYWVGVVTGTAAIGTANLPLAEVPFDLPAVTDSLVTPLGQRIYIPAGVQISLALACNAAAATAVALVLVSRQK